LVRAPAEQSHRRPWLAGLRLPSLRGCARPLAKLDDADNAGIVVGQRQRTTPGTAPRSAAHKARRRDRPACWTQDCRWRILFALAAERKEGQRKPKIRQSARSFCQPF